MPVGRVARHNYTSPVKFEIESSVDAACTPWDVMEIVTNPATWPEWQPEITSAKGTSPISPGDVVTGTASMLGFKVHGHAMSIEVTPDHYVQDVVVGVKLRVRYEVQPGPRGAVIAHRLTADMPRGFSGRILSFFLRRRLRIMQREALAGIAAHAEGSAGS